MTDSVCDLELQVSLASPQTRDAAAAVIYERYSPDMRRIARKRMQDRFAKRLCLEDVIQSTWRSFHGCASSLRVTESFWPYLYTILKRKLSKVSDWHTAAKRNVAREANLAHVLEEIIPGPKDRDLLWLHEAVNELNGFYRQVIELRLAGYSQIEIANMLGKSARFVQRYQKSAIEMLRAQLAEDGR